MKYTDLIYGEVEIEEAVIIDIINTSAFQRLKGVGQAGYCLKAHLSETKHSRFEHSVGCYILLKKFNASIEEQIAGLIHDMSHSAFSHTADYIFDTGRGADHNYQDDIFVGFVEKTDVPQILKRYGFDVAYVLDERNFPLQETKLPSLCADRIDYSLRGAVVYGVITAENALNILKHLHIIDDQWVFDDYIIARKYAEIFKKLNDVYYSNKEAATTYLRTSRWIKHAIKMGYITHDDLFATDEKVITRINTYLDNDTQLQKLWNEMNNSEIVLGTKYDKNTEEIVVKSRIVDPLFLEGSKIRRVSQYDSAWGDIVTEDSIPKIYYVM